MRTWRFMVWMACAAGLGLIGCAPVTPVLPPYAGMFTDIGAPVDLTFKENAIGPRAGRAKASNVLGLVAFGDASVDAAMREGKLTRADQIDCHIFNVLGVYSSYETIVHGE